MATLKNRNDLQAEAAANLPDNTTQAISPQDVRQMAENLAESNFNKITDGPLVGLKPYNTGVIYETGQGANYLGNLYFANKTTTLGAFVAADWNLFASNVSDLNDLSDVATGLPGTPTIVDDTKLLFYDKATSKFITDDIITAGTVVINAKKSSAGTIAKGKPVYLVGFDSDLHTVEEANAGAVGTMPVIGFAAENMDATNAKKITTFGKLTGLNTSAFSLGADLYISTTTGTLTATRPTGAGSFIQRVAKVLKSAASGGQLFIFNTARAAGLPNLAQNNVWMGDANGQPQAVNKSTIVPTDAQIEIGYNNQVPEVTQSEAEAGTVTTVKRWTPQRVKQAIDALASGGDSIYTANGTVPSSIIATLTNTLRFKNGAFEIQGAGTTTGTTLALYDNDSTPSKTWEWLDNGTMKGYNTAKIQDALILPSVQELANSATFTINADQQSDGVLTAMSASTTIAAPTGTPVQSQDLVFRFKDNGTAQALAWNGVFRAIGVTLPTTTVSGKLTYVGCKYNSTDSKWDVVAVQQEA